MNDILKTAVKLALGRGSVRSYGQFGEDALIQKLFKKREKGTYVDVGAFHPTLYSNTYALYKKGWQGLVIDPNDKIGPLFRAFRPRDKFIQMGIGEPFTKIYREYEDPAYNTFVEGFVTRPPLKERPVFTIPLSALLDREKIKHVDFLNVDVEGMDLEVLKTHDWAIIPDVIAVETTLGGEAHMFLQEKGYLLAGKAGPTLILKHEVVG
jgi:FkbM family methyltransferase